MTDPMAMVMEFIPHGDLHGVIHNKQITFDWKYRLRIVWDIVQGYLTPTFPLFLIARMNYVHSLDPPLVHRDLKSPNVMIASLDYDAPAVAKGIPSSPSSLPLPPLSLPDPAVADFGLTRELLTENFRGEKAATRDVTNPTWLAPEVLKAEPNGLPADVYAFGGTPPLSLSFVWVVSLSLPHVAVMLWEILVRQHPFAGYASMIELENAIIKGARPEIPPTTPEAYDLLVVYIPFHLSLLSSPHIVSHHSSCWEADPELRPTFHQVIELIDPLVSKLCPQLKPILTNVTRQGSSSSPFPLLCPSLLFLSLLPSSHHPSSLFTSFLFLASIDPCRS